MRLLLDSNTILYILRERAAAVRDDATLVTSNTRHFTGLGVALLDWLDPADPAAEP